MSRKQLLVRLGLVLLCVLFLASPASAQLTSLGTAATGFGGFNAGVAHDDKHDVFLQVWSGGSVARFIHADGTPAGEQFPVGGCCGALQPVYTRGTSDDEFLIIHLAADSQNQYTGHHATRVRFTGTGPTGGQELNPGAHPLVLPVTSTPTDLVFNPVTRRYLLAYTTNSSASSSSTETSVTSVQQLNLDGTPFGPPVTVATNAIPLATHTRTYFAARLSFDWRQNRYLVVRAYGRQARSEPRNPELSVDAYALDGTSLQQTATISLFNGSVQDFPEAGDLGWSCFLPETGGFLVPWTLNHDLQLSVVPADLSSSGLNTYTAIQAAGPDRFSTVDFDPESRMALLVAQGDNRVGTSIDRLPFLTARLIDEFGAPLGAASYLRDSGQFHVHVAAARNGRFALGYTGRGNNTVFLERFSVPLASSPGRRWSNAYAQIDAPAAGASTTPNFTLTGSAIDFGASTGIGIDAVHAWALPSSGNPIFLGAQTVFQNHPANAALWGERFRPSGFQIQTPRLPAGTYTIAVYPHSSISGAFGSPAVSLVTVASQPLMALDSPANGSSQPGIFRVEGWAIDRAAATGVGVDQIHVWAFPTNGGAPIFAGATAPSISRPDIAALFGAQFESSGYRLDARLYTGSYWLVAYAFSTVTNSFNQWSIATITVPGGTPNPAMAIDEPAVGATVTAGQPFTIRGWAVDRGSLGDAGVATLHVWAFPTTGGAAMFLGVASYGSARPDVGNVFGAQFNSSGYSLSATLPAGTYDVAVYAQSWVTGTFNQALVRRVTVQ